LDEVRMRAADVSLAISNWVVGPGICLCQPE
jgi:hypothetical protein